MPKWFRGAWWVTEPLPAGIIGRLFFLGILFAAASTLIVSKVWNPHQTYPDVITGALPYLDLNKGRELTLMLLFLAGSAFFSCVLLRLTATVTQGTDGAYEWLCPLLDVPLVCLAYWTGFQLVRFDWNQLPLEALAAAGVLFVALLALRRFALPQYAVQRIGLWILLELLLLAFGGFGIGLMATFALAGAKLTPGTVGLLYFLGGLCFLGAVLWRSTTSSQLVRRLAMSTYLFQVPIPFLFFTVLQRDTVSHGNRIVEHSSLLLKTSLWLACMLAWFLLYLRFARHRKLCPCRPRAHVQPFCLAAIAVCLAASNQFVPGIYMDDFHLGEQFLPWQQLTQFGRLPYIDLIPIHGAMALLRGAVNSLFFEGSIASFESAGNLIRGSAAALTFICLFRFGGLVPPLLYCLCVFTLDRFYFVGPILLWMTQPARFRSPIRWLVLGVLLASFALIYNVPVGAAVIVGLLPAAIQEALRAWRAGFAQNRILLLSAAALVMAIVAIAPARHTVIAFVQFAAENGAINTTANDIPWSGIPEVSSPDPEAIASSLVFAGLKFGWMAIALLALLLLGNQVRTGPAGLASLTRIRSRLLWAVALSCLVIMPWTAGRIDGGLSRTGLFSAYCAAVFLPVIATRFTLTHHPFRMPPTAFLIVIAALLGLYAPETGMITSLKSVALRLSPVVTVPNGWVRVIGSEHGLPNLGAIYIAPDKLGELTHLNAAISGFVGNRGTYFDLTNRQALYSMCRREAPTLYPASYVAASHQQQDRILAQLKANGQKVVFISPALNIEGTAALRTYLLYRYAVLNFRPCKVQDDVFMLDLSLDRSRCEDVSDQALLDEKFSFWTLSGLPSAWGGSWLSLGSLFDQTTVPALESRIRPHDLNWDGKQFTMQENTFDEQAYLTLYPDVAAAVNRGAFPSGYSHFVQVGRAEGRVTPALKHPSFWVLLEDLKIDPRKSDFVTFQFLYPHRAMARIPMEIRWHSENGTSKPIEFTLDGDRVLLPMGSYPEWLTARTITALRIKFNCEECLRSFRVSDFKLLHYKPADAVPSMFSAIMAGRKQTTADSSTTVIQGYIDSPKNNEVVSSDFIVAGWAIANAGTIQDVLISVDGKSPAIARPSVPRPDVAKAFPNIPDAKDSGWNILIPIATLQPGRHEISFTVRLQDGRQQSLDPVNVKVIR